MNKLSTKLRQKQSIVPQQIIKSRLLELSIDELKDMIADQRTMGSKIFAGLSPLTKLIMWDQTRRTKAEIERRIADPNTSGVDLMRLKNLK